MRPTCNVSNSPHLQCIRLRYLLRSSAFVLIIVNEAIATHAIDNCTVFATFIMAHGVR